MLWLIVLLMICAYCKWSIDKEARQRREAERFRDEMYQSALVGRIWKDERKRAISDGRSANSLVSDKDAFRRDAAHLDEEEIRNGLWEGRWS